MMNSKRKRGSERDIDVVSGIDRDKGGDKGYLVRLWRIES